MDFSRRYLLGLILPPAILGLLFDFLFITQVVQFSRSSMIALIVITVASYGIGGLAFVRFILPSIHEFQESLRGRADVSGAMSRCFSRTATASITFWFGSGLVAAIAGALVIFPSALGFGYFLSASLLVGGVAIPWDYFYAKRSLLDAAPRDLEISYTGRQLPLGRKIAIVFIGLFIVAAVALVQLVSSRVSTTLEKLAIDSEAERFDRLFDSASSAPSLNADLLETLEGVLPENYHVFEIRPDGEVISSGAQTLGKEEIAIIRSIRNGNSLAYVADDVTRFQQLPSGGILVLTIPWAPYRNIPYQIAFYTLIITILTTAIFSVAALLLSRDTRRPLSELSHVAGEMANGNFQTTMTVFADDEMGTVAASFRETRENLRRLVGKIGGSGKTITNGVRVIGDGTTGLLSRAHQQAELTERSSSALVNVRKGSESVLGSAESVTELTQDASSRSLELQAAAEEVARNMDQLFQSVEKTSSSTTEMDASAREMNGRMEFLANIGEEVLSFVAEMDSTVRELRLTAQSSAEISRQVREDAEAGGTAVNQTVEGIEIARDSTRRTAETLDDLQERIEQITRILNVIEDITERTNLLSLNAAIIAAQAGEHGLGFSVVAEEIRELAERTRGSTNEIGGIIKAVQAASAEAVSAMHTGVDTVNQNVTVAQHASDSLSKILTSAQRSWEMSTKMSQALQEQAQASQRLHEVTSRMSDHITEINRSTQEQARGTRMLAEEADRVRDIALQVKNSTDEQSVAGRGISDAMEKIAADVRSIRDLLQQQLEETERIADASQTMLGIAQENQSMAEEFNATVNSLSDSAREFEREVSRFRIG